MKTSNRITRLVDDLAAHWTEPVLEILKGTGKAYLTVQSEIEAWHKLSAALETELQGLRTFRLATIVSFDALKEQVFGRAIAVLARKNTLLPTSNELEQSIRQLIRDRRSAAAEHKLFGELVREPALRGEFKSPRQTDFVPKVRLSAVSV